MRKNVDVLVPKPFVDNQSTDHFTRDAPACDDARPPVVLREAEDLWLLYPGYSTTKYHIEAK